LAAQSRERGLKLLLDFVPCHTSIEHPWFREHPEWYVWANTDGPPNNWVSAFGGPAWSRDERTGRWGPALVLSRATGPRLAQSRGRGGNAAGREVLGRPRRRRIQDRRDRPAHEGPGASRRPALE